jgi:hypothetical protein
MNNILLLGIILIIIFILIIIYEDKMKYNLNIQKPEDNYIDNLIIGAGIGGTYLAARLHKLKPKETILLIDKNSDFGGQQTSFISYDNVAIELGPVRFYEFIHLRILKLAQKYNTPLIEYLPSSKGQIIYLRGIPYKETNLFPDSDNSYNIYPHEKGKNPFDLLNENLTKLIPNTKDLYKLEKRMKLINENNDFSNKSFLDLAQMNMSQENFQRIMDILGYYDLLSLRSAFLINAIEFLSLSNKSEKQYRFKEGYSSLTKKIAENNNINIIRFKDIDKNKPQVSCSFNTEIIKIEKNYKHNLWIVTYGYTIINSIEQINNKIIKTSQIKVKNIYYTGSTQVLPRICNVDNDYLNYIKNSFIPISALRIYLRYSHDWMTDMGIGFGKSVTTLPGGQIIHYADKYIMFYIFGSQTNLLNSKIPKKQIQKELIKPNNETYELVHACNNIIKQTFNIKIDLPNVTDLAWASWIAPFRVYSARNLQSFNNENIINIFDKLMVPFGKNGNFYVLSNEIGLNAAWCEGSLENVDYFFNKFYNQPLFGPDLL